MSTSEQLFRQLLIGEEHAVILPGVDLGEMKQIG